MWIQENGTTTTDDSYPGLFRSEPTKGLYHSNEDDKNRYEEEEEEEDDAATTTSTGATLSTMMVDQEDTTCQQPSPFSLMDTPPPSQSDQIAAFEKNLRDTLPSRNTYFLDGGNRFISLPTLGNANTKTAAHLSRLFEEWLQDKLCNQLGRVMTDRLPILEDSVDLLAEDILNKLKSRASVRGLGTGVAKIMIKVRTGHVYCFDQLIQQDAQTMSFPHLLTPDMMDFIQQFPLFLDTTIYIEPKSAHYSPSSSDSWDMEDSIPVLLSIENVSTNPSDPYYLFENVSLIV